MENRYDGIKKKKIFFKPADVGNLYLFRKVCGESIYINYTINLFITYRNKQAVQLQSKDSGCQSYIYFKEFQQNFLQIIFVIQHFR